MPVALDATHGTSIGSGVNPTSITTAAIPAGGTIIAVWGCYDPGAGTRTIGGGGLTWTQEDVHLDLSHKLIVARAYHAAGGAVTVTFTNTAPGSADNICGVVSYTGVADAVAVAVASATTSAASWGSGSVAATAGCLLVGGTFLDVAGGGAAGNGAVTSPGNERLERNVSAQNETLLFVDKIGVAGSDSLDGTWTTGGKAVTSAVALAAAAETMQEFLPDADTVTTGWTSTPLYSRLSDSSDGTYVTGVLA